VTWVSVQVTWASARVIWVSELMAIWVFKGISSGSSPSSQMHLPIFASFHSTPPWLGFTSLLYLSPHYHFPLPFWLSPVS